MALLLSETEIIST